MKVSVTKFIKKKSKCYKVKHMIVPYFKGILKVVFAIFPEFSH
jgi:hypothetical protein